MVSAPCRAGKIAKPTAAPAVQGVLGPSSRTMRVPAALPIVIATLLVCALQSPIAHADIYTWVDSAGRTNVSNLEPPEGARVTNVVREKPPTPSEAAAREAQRRKELTALEDQV